jgi:hypothetical protein
VARAPSRAATTWRGHRQRGGGGGEGGGGEVEVVMAEEEEQEEEEEEEEEETSRVTSIQKAQQGITTKTTIPASRARS